MGEVAAIVEMSAAACTPAFGAAQAMGGMRRLKSLPGNLNASRHADVQVEPKARAELHRLHEEMKLASSGSLGLWKSSALHRVVLAGGSMRMLRLLLGGGADPELANEEDTAAGIAEEQGSFAAATLLRR